MRGLASMVTGAFALLTLAACGEDVRLERRTVTYPNGKSVKEDWTYTRLPNGDTLSHGVHKKFFWNGSASESVIWKMGKKDGSAQAWYDNGAAKWQKAYAEGEKKGTWRLFYADGQPWIVAEYAKGKLDGKVQVWGKIAGEAPREAEFDQGNCKSGDCSLLELPPLPPETAPAPEKAEAARTRDILKDFLDLD